MANTTATLTSSVQVYYEKKFLENLKREHQYNEFTRKYSIPRGSGPVIYFTRYTLMPGATSALTEGTTPTLEDLSDNRVSTTLSQYGNATQISDLLLGVHISGTNQFIEQSVDELSYQAKDTTDLLVRNAMAAGTNITYAKGRAALSDVNGSADNFAASDIRKIVRALKRRAVPTWDGQHYIGIIAPEQQYDLLSEATTGGWLDANKYATPENIYKGEIGRLYGVRFYTSTNTSSLSTTATSGTVYEAYFFGKDVVGAIDLAGMAKGSRRLEHINLYIKLPNDSGTSDPLEQRATVGYKMTFGAKLLDNDRMQKLVSGGTG